MITYKNFINLLEEKNILLYDFQKRISYNRLLKIQINQKGGAFTSLTEIDDWQLERLIISLLNKDFNIIEKLFIEPKN